MASCCCRRLARHPPSLPGLALPASRPHYAASVPAPAPSRALHTTPARARKSGEALLRERTMLDDPSAAALPKERLWRDAAERLDDARDHDALAARRARLAARAGSSRYHRSSPFSLSSADGADADDRTATPWEARLRQLRRDERLAGVDGADDAAAQADDLARPWHMPRDNFRRLAPTTPEQRERNRDLPTWQVQKESLARKFPEGWRPLKRLSPDAMEGIRALHRQFPQVYTTPVLANRFQVSPEAIRRILASNFVPNAEEEVKRQERWIKRGENIWQRYSALGIKPPRRWRDETDGLHKYGPDEAGPAGRRRSWNRSDDEVEDDEDELPIDLQDRVAAHLM